MHVMKSYGNCNQEIALVQLPTDRIGSKPMVTECAVAITSKTTCSVKD